MTKMNLHWVDSPDEKGEASNGGVEAANLTAASHGGGAAVVDELPDEDEVGGASHGVPAPLGWALLITEGGEHTSQAHDDVGDDGDEDVSAAQASQKGQVEEQERGGQGPVDITCPVDLTVDVCLDVWHAVFSGLTLNNVVVADTLAAGHGEV